MEYDKNEQNTNPETELACEIFRSARMGSESAGCIISKVTDKFMLSDVTALVEGYSDYASRAAQMLHDNCVNPKELSFGKKFSARAGVAMNTMMDSSAPHIASMLRKGLLMGADELEGFVRELDSDGDGNGKVFSLAREMIDFERKMAEKFKIYIKEEVGVK